MTDNREPTYQMNVAVPATLHARLIAATPRRGQRRAFVLSALAEKLDKAEKKGGD